MAFAVVYDACVLYPSVTRDVLIRTGITGTARTHWSQTILDEVARNLLANRPDITAEQHARMVELMNLALPGAMVTDYEDLVDSSSCLIPTTGTFSRSPSKPGPN